VPLLPPTRHTINDDVLDKLKPGVILINSSRGGLVDTKSVLKGIQAGIISGYGADVYENESDYFFQDWSARSIPDPTLIVSYLLLGIFYFLNSIVRISFFVCSHIPLVFTNSAL
jgi:lactate dehydrogenase-like 2-hydroxyacid dehydrogenase